MSHSPNGPTLLEELDKRQDEVLNELDRLNSQIESLLRECLHQRNAELQSAAA